MSGGDCRCPEVTGGDGLGSVSRRLIFVLVEKRKTDPEPSHGAVWRGYLRLAAVWGAK